MGKTALVIGASGLVGQQLVNQLLVHPEFEKVRIFVRRTTKLSHPKLDEQIIDFDRPEIWKNLVQGDVLFLDIGNNHQNGKNPKRTNTGLISPISMSLPKRLSKMAFRLTC